MAEGAELTPLLIAQAAEEGDQVADDVVMDTARYLGVGTTTLMHTINPSMFLFGGAMTFGRNETPLGRRFLQAIKDEVKKRAFHVPFERTIIDFATLGGRRRLHRRGWLRPAEIRPEIKTPSRSV